jgi:hypothetical protein
MLQRNPVRIGRAVVAPKAARRAAGPGPAYHRGVCLRNGSGILDENTFTIAQPKGPPRDQSFPFEFAEGLDQGSGHPRSHS